MNISTLLLLALVGGGIYLVASNPAVINQVSGDLGLGTGTGTSTPPGPAPGPAPLPAPAPDPGTGSSTGGRVTIPVVWT